MPGAERSESSQPLGRQLNVAARVVRALLDAALADAGITFSDWLVILALQSHGPAIQRDLGRQLNMIGASMVERIDQLESAGLVARSAEPEDRRAYRITLTEAGSSLYNKVHLVMRATESAILDGLTEREVATTRRALLHITERATQLRAQRAENPSGPS